MWAKYFYLVRHGQTILNSKKIRQGPEGGLSELGVKEVEDLGERLLYMNIQKIFVSPYERAVETANIINKYLKLKDNRIIKTKLIEERKNPSNIIGLHYDDPLAKRFVEIMDKSIHDPNLRISDEENFQDLKDRAIKAQKFLKKNGKKYNLCVTHGIFLKMFLSTLLYGKNLKVKDYIQMNMYNPADNAGVTLIKYYPIKKFFIPLQKFSDYIFGDNKNLNNNISKLNKYSAWEILAYNDYTRKGFEKNI